MGITAGVGYEYLVLSGSQKCGTCAYLYLFTIPNDEDDEISTDGSGPKGRNIITKLLNALISAMKGESALPKYIVMVLEDDTIQYLNYNDFGVTAMFGKIFNAINTELRRGVMQFRDQYLPKKATRPDWPQIIWVYPSLHANYSNNSLRKKFSNEMEKIVDFHPTAHVCKLARCDWDTERDHLVDKESGDITTNGKRRFWHAVDKLLSTLDNDIFNQPDYDFLIPAAAIEPTRRRIPDFGQNRRPFRRPWNRCVYNNARRSLPDRF